MEQKYYTYYYQDPSRNNEIFYVGKGSERRCKRHLTRKDHHPMTYRIGAMRRANVDPIIKVIPCPTEQDALSLETDLIESIGRKDLGTGPLLNMIEGGSQPPTRSGKDNPFFGKKHTDETKAKISASKKGIDISPEAREKWRQKMAIITKTQEFKDKTGGRWKGISKSPEQRQKMAEARKRWWALKKK